MGWLTTPTPFPPAVPLEWLWGGSGTGNRAQGLHTHLLAGLAELGGASLAGSVHLPEREHCYLFHRCVWVRVRGRAVDPGNTH